MKTAQLAKRKSAKHTGVSTKRAQAGNRAEMRPLTPEEQQMWESLDRAPRSPGRPKIGQGAKNVLVSLELSLLERTDAFAKDHALGRSQLIARAIERYLRDATEIESDFNATPADRS